MKEKEKFDSKLIKARRSFLFSKLAAQFSTVKITFSNEMNLFSLDTAPHKTMQLLHVFFFFLKPDKVDAHCVRKISFLFEKYWSHEKERFAPVLISTCLLEQCNFVLRILFVKQKYFSIDSFLFDY